MFAVGSRGLDVQLHCIILSKCLGEKLKYHQNGFFFKQVENTTDWRGCQ